MNKLIYAFVAIAIMVAGANTASADKLIIPNVSHYGSNDYSMINIKNQSGAGVAVTATFANGVVGPGTTTTTQTTTTKYKVIGPNAVWTILTNSSSFWGSTTQLKRPVVTIQTSATNHPLAGSTTSATIGRGGIGAGPVTVSAMFIHINSSTFDPSGFAYPVLHRVRTWVTGTRNVGAPGQSGSITVDNWMQ